MTTNKRATYRSLSCIKHTLKTTLDDKKVDYKWTTLGLLYFSPDIFLTISNFQPNYLNLNKISRGVGNIYKTGTHNLKKFSTTYLQKDCKLI